MIKIHRADQFNTSLPIGKRVMYQEWYDLLFLHWIVDEHQLRNLIPNSLRLDSHGGKYFVGLLPFSMRNIHPTYLPPIHGFSAFHELNLRTYVLGPDGTPGIWFFSLDAPNIILNAVAKNWFHLPYHNSQFNVKHLDTNHISYECFRNNNRSICANVNYSFYGDAQKCKPNTLDEFLIERYWLYVTSKNTLYRARVFHKPYLIQRIELSNWNESILAAAGITRSDEQPLAHYSTGVCTDVHGLQRIK